MGQFRGKIELKMTLLDLVQFITISGKDGKLLLRSGADNATLFFRGGRLVHAEVGSVQGIEAFYKVAVWEGGDFFFAEIGVDCPKTISVEPSSLLLEAAHLSDEKNISQPRYLRNKDGNEELSPLRLAYLRYLQMGEPEHEEKQEVGVPEIVTPKRSSWPLILGVVILGCLLMIWLIFFGFKN